MVLLKIVSKQRLQHFPSGFTLQQMLDDLLFVHWAGFHWQSSGAVKSLAAWLWNSWCQGYVNEVLDVCQAGVKLQGCKGTLQGVTVSPPERGMLLASLLHTPALSGLVSAFIELHFALLTINGHLPENMFWTLTDLQAALDVQLRTLPSSPSLSTPVLLAWLAVTPQKFPLRLFDSAIYILAADQPAAAALCPDYGQDGLVCPYQLDLQGVKLGLANLNLSRKGSLAVLKERLWLAHVAAEQQQIGLLVSQLANVVPPASSALLSYLRQQQQQQEQQQQQQQQQPPENPKQPGQQQTEGADPHQDNTPEGVHDQHEAALDGAAAAPAAAAAAADTAHGAMSHDADGDWFTAWGPSVDQADHEKDMPMQEMSKEQFHACMQQKFADTLQVWTTCSQLLEPGFIDSTPQAVELMRLVTQKFAACRPINLHDLLYELGKCGVKFKQTTGEAHLLLGFLLLHGNQHGFAVRVPYMAVAGGAVISPVEPSDPVRLDAGLFDALVGATSSYGALCSRPLGHIREAMPNPDGDIIMLYTIQRSTSFQHFLEKVLQLGFDYKRIWASNTAHSHAVCGNDTNYGKLGPQPVSPLPGMCLTVAEIQALMLDGMSGKYLVRPQALEVYLQCMPVELHVITCRTADGLFMHPPNTTLPSDQEFDVYGGLHGNRPWPTGALLPLPSDLMGGRKKAAIIDSITAAAGDKPRGLAGLRLEQLRDRMWKERGKQELKYCSSHRKMQKRDQIEQVVAELNAAAAEQLDHLIDSAAPPAKRRKRGAAAAGAVGATSSEAEFSAAQKAEWIQQFRRRMQQFGATSVVDTHDSGPSYVRHDPQQDEQQRAEQARQKRLREVDDLGTKVFIISSEVLLQVSKETGLPPESLPARVTLDKPGSQSGADQVVLRAAPELVAEKGRAPNPEAPSG